MDGDEREIMGVSQRGPSEQRWVSASSCAVTHIIAFFDYYVYFFLHILNKAKHFNFRKQCCMQ